MGGQARIMKILAALAEIRNKSEKKSINRKKKNEKSKENRKIENKFVHHFSSELPLARISLKQIIISRIHALVSYFHKFAQKSMLSYASRMDVISVFFSF